MTDEQGRKRVIVVGGGFAGVACARELAKRHDVAVTLIDSNDYHQFQPLLYQVATSMLASRDIAYPLRQIAAEYDGFEAKRAEVVAIDPKARSVTTRTGETYTGDYLVLAAGSQPSFFGTPGAEHAFPLYSLDDAERLRTRVIQAFEEADRDPSLIDQGAIDFVVVGGGPTGVEVAGALAEMIATTMVHEFPAIAPRARVHVINHGKTLLAMFADKGHAYTARILEKDHVDLRLGVGVTEIGPGHVALSDGSTVLTRCVVWGGGLKAAPIAEAAGLPQGKGGRVDVQPDMTVPGFPGVLAIGDIANIPDGKDKMHPQLGSVALQSGPRGSRDDHRRPRRAYGQAVPLSRQGDDGHDRPRRGDRPGPARHRAPREGGVRRLARRPCRPHDRRQQPGRRLRELGQGLLRQATRAAGARSERRGADDLGRRRRRRDGGDGEGCGMSHDDDYDIIIVGSGAGGGTLAGHLAPSGKRILLVERGPWLPREIENWDADAVFVKNRYVSADTWYDDQGKSFQPGIHYYVGGQTKFYGAALYRLRREDFGELHHHDGLSPAWPISYDDIEPYYTKAEHLYEVRGVRGEDPTEPSASARVPPPGDLCTSRASSSSPTTWSGPGTTRSTRRAACASPRPTCPTARASAARPATASRPSSRPSPTPR